MHLLVPVGDHAGVDEIDDPIREHLGVNAEVAFVEHAAERGVGNGADAHLQRGAVGNEPGDVLANGLVNRRRRRGQMFGQGSIGQDERVQPRQVHQRVAVRARHAPVHFGNHQACASHRRQRRVDRRAERAVTVSIGRRDLNESHVERDPAGGEQGRDVGEKDRQVVGAAVGDGLAHRRAGKQRHRQKSSLVPLVDERRRPGGVEVIQRHPRQVRPPDQRLDEGGRCRGRAVDEHAHAALDRRDGGVGAYCAVLKSQLSASRRITSARRERASSPCASPRAGRRLSPAGRS